MAMIQMFHPDLPGSTTYVEQDAFRTQWYPLGWRSNEDAYTAVEHLTPGVELDSTPLDADMTSVGAGPGELVGAAYRLSLPELGQPILLEAHFQLAAVGGSTNTGVSIGFCRVGDIGNILGWQAIRQYEAIPVNATAGRGIAADLYYRVPANIDAADWTIGALRTSGDRSTQMKGDASRAGLFIARAM